MLLLRGREVPRGVELFDIVLGVGFLPMRALGVELLVLGVELADPGREFVRPEVPLGERGEKLRLGEYRGVKQGALSDSSSCCSAIRAAALSTAQTVASTATRGSCRGVITNAIRRDHAWTPPRRRDLSLWVRFLKRRTDAPCLYSTRYPVPGTGYRYRYRKDLWDYGGSKSLYAEGPRVTRNGAALECRAPTPILERRARPRNSTCLERDVARACVRGERRVHFAPFLFAERGATGR